MTHPSDDQLLELSLQLLDDDETLLLREHLDQCDQCRERFARTLSDTALLGSVRAGVEPPLMPSLRAHRIMFSPILKAAALLVLGFFGGLAAADLVRKPEVNVVPSYLIVSSPPDSVARYPVSDATALGVNLH
jgi:hypothetical protein